MTSAERVAMGVYTADTLISDVLRTSPETAAVFTRFGLGCPSCLASGLETVSAVASMHDVAVDELLAALNDPMPIDAEEA